ncbi:MAG: DUF3135 domain-containing protein [Spongiibacteraceae bacterium]|jgi:hypothetical protein|nr:DUF3135 domain-containing protein [Spongiibacteraceae bacterium]
MHAELPTELPSFDTLRHLAEHDPEQLETLRHHLAEQLIAGASTPQLQARLRGLQFEIDMRVRLAPNPIAACITVSQMMHRSLEQLQRTLNGDHWQVPPAEATIIPLPTRH